MPSGSDQLAISVENLSVSYRARIEQQQTLKSALRRLGRASQEVHYIKALKDVSFSLEFGAFLGVVGHNGAGKSTLLRAIGGILPPSRGKVVVNGYVTTLLAVGIGFNGELSGRENIRLGGLSNGLRPRQIAAKEEEIVEFSGVGEFIDYPLKTYSSGMRSRLGFAVAVHMDPDILLIDEALSAGDAAFRDQAAQKIKEMMARARAIVLVSHGLSVVTEMASEAIWLDHGRLIQHGEPAAVVKAYTDHVASGASKALMDDI